jgi:hypothetical protein
MDGFPMRSIGMCQTDTNSDGPLIEEISERYARKIASALDAFSRDDLRQLIFEIESELQAEGKKSISAC